eukprot:7376328-Prymnesium_polylepis.1
MDMADARLATNPLTLRTMPHASCRVQARNVLDEEGALEADTLGRLSLLDARALPLTKLPPAHLDASAPLAGDAPLGISTSLDSCCMTQPASYRRAAEDGQQPSCRGKLCTPPVHCVKLPTCLWIEAEID